MDTARARSLRVHAPARGGDPGGARRQPCCSRTGCSSTPRNRRRSTTRTCSRHAWRRFGLRVGQFKVPYGLQRWTYSGELEFVDHLGADGRVLAGTRHRPDGHRPAVRGPAASTSCRSSTDAGAGRRNDNIDLAYAARIVAAPWGRCRRAKATSNGTRGRAPRSAWPATTTWSRPTRRAHRRSERATPTSDRDGRIDNVAIWQGGAELRALWRGAALQAELFGRTESPGRRCTRRAATGAPTCRRATS